MRNQPQPITLANELVNASEVQQAVIANFDSRTASLFNANALQALQDPKILACTPQSVKHTLITSAKIGITLSKEMGLAYIIVYGNNATLQLSYKGLKLLALKTGLYQKIDTMFIYPNDFELSNDELIARNNSLLPIEPIGEPVGILAYAITKTGEILGEYMTLANITKIRNSIAGASDPKSAWTTNPETMYKKTVIRRLLKDKVALYSFINGQALDMPSDDGDNMDDINPNVNHANELNESVTEATAEATAKGIVIDLTENPERFKMMIEKIKAGKYAIKTALDNIKLSDEQRQQLLLLQEIQEKGEF